MGKNKKGILSKKYLLLALVALVMVGSLTSNSYGQEDGEKKWGFSFSGGVPQKSKHDLTMWSFLPRVDLPLHKKWDFEIEGSFSYYIMSEIKDLYLLGLNTNILFKPIRWNTGSLFLIGGVGLAYNNNTDSNHKTRDIGDTHVAGILQVGSGINYHIGKGWWLRGEYRFQHISDPFKTDVGINTHNFILGVSF